MLEEAAVHQDQVVAGLGAVATASASASTTWARRIARSASTVGFIPRPFGRCIGGGS
jgi:hypothetical protein